MCEVQTHGIGAHNNIFRELMSLVVALIFGFVWLGVHSPVNF